MSEGGLPEAAAAGTARIGGLTVRRMAFGAMRLTGPGVWGPPADRAEAVAVLRRAVELGVELIDTADAYGPAVNEEIIAEALHPYPEGVVIATKAGLTRPAPGVWRPNGRPEHIRQACDGSLGRLRLEQIPLYQLHRPDPAVPLAESVGALVELKQQGKVRHIGLSNVSVAELRAAQQLTQIASVQNRYTVADRSSDAVLELCAAEGIAFLPWAPLHDAEHDRRVAEIARRRAVTTAQVVLAWLLARSPAIVVIPGTSSGAHLAENVAAASLRLSPDEVAALGAGPSVLRRSVRALRRRLR